MQNLTPEPDPHTLGLKPWHFVKTVHCLAPPDSTVKLPAYSQEGRLGSRARGGDRHAGAQRVDREARSTTSPATPSPTTSRRATSAKRPHVPDTSPFKYDWLGQKCFDGACPLGPWIVPAATIADPQNLAIKLWVNDVIKQDSNTGQMIFTLAEQIAHLSHAHHAASRRRDPDRHAGRRRPGAQGIPEGRRRGEGVGRRASAR